MDRLVTGIYTALALAGATALYVGAARADDQPPVLQLPDTAPIPTPRPDPDVAEAQAKCAPFKELRAAMAENHFKIAGGAMEGAETQWIVFADRHGGYSMWVIRPDKTACLISAGNDWFSLPVGDLV